jgi:hypothetical protein
MLKQESGIKVRCEAQYKALPFSLLLSISETTTIFLFFLFILLFFTDAATLCGSWPPP